jgi:hypothetical protein
VDYMLGVETKGSRCAGNWSFELVRVRALLDLAESFDVCSSASTTTNVTIV